MANASAYWQNVRILRMFSLLFLGLTVASMWLIHSEFYEPAVSYLLFYLTVAFGVTLAGVLLLLPVELFSDETCAGAYALYAVLFGLMIFFSGGVSSALFVLYFPLILSAALHGVLSVGLIALVSTLFVYLFTSMPDLLSGEGEGGGLALYRLAFFALMGAFALIATRGIRGEGGLEDYATDEDGSMLLEVVSNEISAGGGEKPVAVILVDPGRGIDDVDQLLKRVRGRIAEPILLGEGGVFGMVLGGVDERAVEIAAERAQAAANSLGARHTVVGAAIYPRDAQTPAELLEAAGGALAAASGPDSSGVTLADRTS